LSSINRKTGWNCNIYQMSIPEKNFYIIDEF